MDNVKTGELIKARRKELGMTQRELAERLHITDRAVSKWERGLCAPDIALLEPLGSALGVSVLDLIEGERRERTEQSGRLEEGTKTVLAYSRREVAHKLSAARRRYWAVLAVLLLTAALACGALLWRSGILFVLDRRPSPDGSMVATIYSKELDGRRLGLRDATSMIVDRTQEDGYWLFTYGDREYRGLWWAPDSKKYVIAMERDGEVWMQLHWVEQNSASNLNAYLSMGVEQSELSKRGYIREGARLEIDYQFLQWAQDSTSMLIYYAFEDEAAEPHTGYFWYNCEKGTVSAVLELE